MLSFKSILDQMQYRRQCQNAFDNHMDVQEVTGERRNYPVKGKLCKYHEKTYSRCLTRIVSHHTSQAIFEHKLHSSRRPYKSWKTMIWCATLGWHHEITTWKREILIIQCYQLIRTKNPDLVVILITDTNFPARFCLFYSVVILFKQLVQYSVQ